MEIGYPTDVKHVAHIGWDGPSGTGPSWVCIFIGLIIENVQSFCSMYHLVIMYADE